MRLFGGYDGYESGDRGCGWFGSVGVVEVVCSVRMGVAVGSVHMCTMMISPANLFIFQNFDFWGF